MSKSKPGGGGGDRKGEGVREGDAPRLISSQAVTAGVPTPRPTLAVGGPGHTFIVQPQHGSQHHDVKNFAAKLTRPIAPAPPTQAAPTIVGRTVQSSQPNIPSIISSSVGRSPTEGLVSLNLVSTTGTSGLGTITHTPITVPVTLPQANVLQLGSSAGAVSGTSTVVPQGIPGSIPINMLRGAGTGQQPQPQIQAFASNFQTHLPRGTTTLSVPKSPAILRQGASASLQIPTPGLSAAVNLPMARQPMLQTKTSTPQATRSPSPAIGGQPVPQAQPQDLSRASFPLHGSIAPVTSGNPGPQLPMHITLNRMGTPVAQDGRTIPAQVPTDAATVASATVSLQQRISVSLSSDTGLQQRLAADIARSNLTFTSQAAAAKMNQQPLGPQAKVISSQPLAQHMAAMKSVNLAVSTPVMINSINPSMATATTTIASSAPIPIASPSTLPAGHSSSAVASLQSSTLPLTASSSSSSSLPLSSSTAATCDPGLVRQEQAVVPSSQTPAGGIIISPEFQARPPGSIITMTTLASSVQGGATPTVISHPENRSTSHSQQQIGIGPSDPMWYQHFVYQQGTQAPLVSQATSTIVRPGTSTFAFLPSQGNKLQTPTSNLTATQLAHHAMSVSSTAVRYNTNMMVMDQMRQQQQQPQQLPLHSGFSTSTTATSSVGEKLAANLASRATVASSIYTASVGVQSQMSGGSGGSGGLSAVPVSNPSSSPRPSILRKRTSEA
ncbi:mucin-5AC isoform X1 [Aplysia californica]|uniref:Mucin-5AC isoform X1 n=1 Tax=Aplysia californica TaxID=6500 RepID=A0ABM0K9N7_APLCA|nr:mucin-5AC isoform X1 [Aplysia californica]XP_035829305.1 mucin-5AC isoform X1 [Aplysia californica]